MVNEVVNNALGLAQYITASLSEVQAVSYLLAVEKLTIDDWAACKTFLPNVNVTNRRSKEKTIEDIVYVLKNEDIETTFLVRDLSILPGLCSNALELITFQAGSMYAVSTFLKNSRSIEAERIQPPAASHFNVAQGQPLQVDNSQQLRTYAATTASSLPITSDNSLSSSSGSLLIKKGSLNKPRNQRKVPPAKTREWVYGTSTSTSSDKSHPLKFVCLGIRSGSDESIDSLTAEIQSWNCVRDLRVEQVRKSYHSSTFRVQYNIADSLSEKWKDPSSWPSRILASEWRGNPRTPLKALKDRTYTKKIYVGSLPESASKELITKNMERIYQEELKDHETHKATVQKIEVFWNEDGLKREKEKKSKDPSYQIMKSVCVVLTSRLGQPLTDITLKLDSYCQEIRRTVRHWRGPTPGQTKQPSINLTWQ